MPTPTPQFVISHLAREEARTALQRKIRLLQEDYIKDPSSGLIATINTALSALEDLDHAQVYNGPPDQLQAIREAVNGYHLALDRREHGGVAQDKAFNKIRNILDLHWEPGAALKAAEAAAASEDG